MVVERAQNSPYICTDASWRLTSYKILSFVTNETVDLLKK